MENKKLLYISLFISISGILIILFLSMFLIKPLNQKISEINEKDINKKIKITGKINSIKTYDKLTLFDLKDETGKIEVIVYKNIKLNINETISVTGIIEKYKEKIRIKAEKIEKNQIFHSPFS